VGVLVELLENRIWENLSMQVGILSKGRIIFRFGADITGSKTSTALIAIAMITISGFAGVMIALQFQPGGSNTDTDPGSLVQYPFASYENFSEYTDYETDYSFNAPQYAIASDLSNVENIERMRSSTGWNEDIETQIAEDYFAAIQNVNYSADISRHYYQQFSEVYDDNYWAELPSFVTTDAMYHTFHVIYDYVLREMEQHNLTYYLTKLCQHLIEVSNAQYDAFEDEWWKEQARMNIAFFSVAMKCLNPGWTIPENVKTIVNQVVALIDAQAGFSIDWFMGQKEDFSQYKPRGHYTRSPELENYFKTMMWLGRINFRAFPNDMWHSEVQNNQQGQNETAQAILIAVGMVSNSSYISVDPFPTWDMIYSPTAFFVGESDDLLPREYCGLLNHIYGTNCSWSDLQNITLLDEFRESVRNLRRPRILSDWILVGDTMESDTQGMSFMGQRFTPDAYILGELVFPNVDSRFMPLGLDVMSAFGSDRADELLESEKNAYPEYEPQMEMLREYISNTTFAQWTQNLYWLWLYSMKPILSEPEEGNPSFMLSETWQDKQLVTALGTWTELKHDTVLYCKQSYTGWLCMPNPPPGYVEPEPEVYARLASLCKMMMDGLEIRDFIGTDAESKLETLHDTLLMLKEISIKELSATPLNEDENMFLKRIGSRLRSLERIGEDVDRAALVTDVHTEPNSLTVLQEATGDPMVVYVAVPRSNGSVYIARGAMFSYYEFAHPIDDRLTDEQWWVIHDSDERPDMPDWVYSFVVEIDSSSESMLEHNRNLWTLEIHKTIDSRESID